MNKQTKTYIYLLVGWAICLLLSILTHWKTFVVAMPFFPIAAIGIMIYTTYSSIKKTNQK